MPVWQVPGPADGSASGPAPSEGPGWRPRVRGATAPTAAAPDGGTGFGLLPKGPRGEVVGAPASLDGGADMLFLLTGVVFDGGDFSDVHFSVVTALPQAQPRGGARPPIASGGEARLAGRRMEPRSSTPRPSLSSSATPTASATAPSAARQGRPDGIKGRRPGSPANFDPGTVDHEAMRAGARLPAYRRLSTGKERPCGLSCGQGRGSPGPHADSGRLRRPDRAAWRRVGVGAGLVRSHCVRRLFLSGGSWLYNPTGTDTQSLST